MEGGPRFEISREATETLRHPERVFDSDKESADRQWRRLIERLIYNGERHRCNRHCEFETIESGTGKAQDIQISWPIPNHEDHAMMLRLKPISEGRGLEQGVLAYTGEYGVAKQSGDTMDFVNREGRVSLEKLFGVPRDIDILVKPTTDRWAIGQDELAVFGENVYTLHMGLGFLFLGHEWMHIGLHEAGHLPNNGDENQAWTYANVTYADRHKPHRARILSGKTQGQFDLLKRPEYYGCAPTIGKIMRFGLTSHALGGNAQIPQRWQHDAERTMREFQNEIIEANDEFDEFIGR